MNIRTITAREILDSRADFADGMMIIRYSQNGPYITVKWDAKTQAKYDERRRWLKKTLDRYPEMVWDEGVNLEALE